VNPQTIIKAYRDKTKIEDVFKNVKSFLKIRPLFVNTEAHVKAVYTICILSYFINRYLANKRKEIGDRDFLNSKELYAPFRDIDIATLTDHRTGRTIKKAVKLPPETKNLLEKSYCCMLLAPSKIVGSPACVVTEIELATVCNHWILQIFSGIWVRSWSKFITIQFDIA